MHLPTPQDLRERRNRLELTQAQVAERAGVSQPLIARIESDDVDPRLSTLRRIVEALDEAEGDVVRAGDLMSTEVVSVQPDDAVSEVITILEEEGYSQLPVLRSGEFRGMIGHTQIVHATEERDEPIGDLPVSEIMDSSTTTVEPDTPLDDFSHHLDVVAAVIVKRDDEVVGIVTEADIAAYVS